MENSLNGDVLKEPASPTLGSEGDFDDDLGVPDSLLIESADGAPGPVNETDANGKSRV